MFTIDYPYLSAIIPDVQRRSGPIRRDWLYLLNTPLKDTYETFSVDVYAFAALLAKHTVQTISLEHLLNSIFAPLPKPIKIIDGNWLDGVYIYQNDERYRIEDNYIYQLSETPNPLLVVPTLYTTDAYERDQIDFLIQHPTLTTDQLNHLRYLVGLYAIAGTTYRLELY